MFMWLILAFPWFIHKELKDCDVINPYELTFFKFEENVDDYSLTEHVDVQKYLAFSDDTIASRKKIST